MSGVGHHAMHHDPPGLEPKNRVAERNASTSGSILRTKVWVGALKRVHCTASSRLFLNLRGKKKVMKIKNRPAIVRTGAVSPPPIYLSPSFGTWSLWIRHSTAYEVLIKLSERCLAVATIHLEQVTQPCRPRSLLAPSTDLEAGHADRGWLCSI